MLKISAFLNLMTVDENTLSELHFKFQRKYACVENLLFYVIVLTPL